MVTFPNCKINLGLNILKKREDGYHDIETVFYPIPVYDVLEIISNKDKTQFTHSGIDTGEDENNLCLKAYRLVKNDFPQVPEISIHLHKVIPMGAGLGGGSSDASFTLSLLNTKYNLEIHPSQLFDYALQLGSDCPFFLSGKPSFATGRGEKLTTIKIDLSAYKMVIVNPGIHINTKEVFQKVKPEIPPKRINEIIYQDVSTWKSELENDFEKIVFPMHPLLKKIKETLYGEGAEYASMSGTGSTLYGIFKKEVIINSFTDKGYFIKSFPL